MAKPDPALGSCGKRLQELLKVRAAEGRSGGLKGLKDRCDILSLLNSGKIDLNKYATECRRYRQADVLEKTLRIVEMAGDEFDYVLGKRQG